MLVVDNNSTDHTREVVEDFCRRHPGLFRYVLNRSPESLLLLTPGLARLMAMCWPSWMTM